MAHDFDDLTSDLAGGQNRFADLFRQVNASLETLAEKTRRLADLFGAIAPPGGGLATASAAWARTGLEEPAGAAALGPTLRQAQAGLLDAPAGRDQDKLAADNARANQQTANAAEELVRSGIKLRELPPAVYSE